MAPRANWKGHLTLGDLSCAVALYTAASTSDRVSFHIINRRTGHRVQRQMVDAETGKPVERDDIVKGYELSSGDYVLLDPDEIAEAVPEATRRLPLKPSFPAMRSTPFISIGLTTSPRRTRYRRRFLTLSGMAWRQKVRQRSHARCCFDACGRCSFDHTAMD